jgi:hypothetical protein
LDSFSRKKAATDESSAYGTKFDGEAVFTKHTQHDIQRAILRRILLGK